MASTRCWWLELLASAVFAKFMWLHLKMKLAAIWLMPPTRSNGFGSDSLVDC